MQRVLAVAINTFREAVRDRVLYGVVGMALGVLLFTLALAEVSLDQQRRVVMDVGLASISVFSVVVAVFLGSSLLYKEIERKTLYVILPKPIARWEFLLGKYLGIVLTAATFIAIMGAVQLWLTSVQAGANGAWLLACLGGLLALLGLAAWRAYDRSAVLLPWSLLALAVCAILAAASGAGFGRVLASLTLNVGEVVVLAAVALVFSAFSTPFLTALFTVGVWLAGRAADDMVAMKSEVLPPAIRELLRVLAEIIPNFNLFVPGRHTLVSTVDGEGPLAYVVTTMGYGLLYASLLLLAAAWIFQRRDLL